MRIFLATFVVAILLVAILQPVMAERFNRVMDTSEREFYAGALVSGGSDSLGAPDHYRINHFTISPRADASEVGMIIQVYKDCDAAAMSGTSGDQTWTIKPSAATEILSYDLLCDKIYISNQRRGAGVPIIEWDWFYTCIPVEKVGDQGCDGKTPWSE